MLPEDGGVTVERAHESERLPLIRGVQYPRPVERHLHVAAGAHLRIPPRTLVAPHSHRRERARVERDDLTLDAMTAPARPRGYAVRERAPADTCSQGARNRHD